MQSREKQPVSAAATTTSSSTIVVSRARILLSLLKINPFVKLTTNDLNKDRTPPFGVFSGRTELYSFPASQSEAAARVQENVTHFIGNYISVFVILFLISLYKQPIPFLTLFGSFPVTDYLDNLIIKKGLDQAYPLIRRLLFFISKLGMVIMLMRMEVVVAFFLSLLFAYLERGRHKAFHSYLLNSYEKSCNGIHAYLEETTVSQPAQHEVLGDSMAWGGCTIIYLLGQQLHFELFDFSHQVRILNVSEVETVSASFTHRNPQVLQGWEGLLEGMKKARRLNNHVFSMLKARCPLENKTACAIKQSGAPLPRDRFENTVSAFETLPQKGTVGYLADVMCTLEPWCS